MPTVSAKVSIEEKATFERIARENGLTTSAMIKQAFHNAEIKDVKQERTIEIDLLFELQRIGKETNEISKKCNISKTVDRLTYATCNRLFEEVKALREDVKQNF